MESVLESVVQGNESTTLAALLVYNDKVCASSVDLDWRKNIMC